MTNFTPFPNAVAAIRRWAALRPDQDAIVIVHDVQARRAEHLSYLELDRRARRVAAALQRRFPVASRVLLLYPPVEFVVGFLGCLYAGMVAVPAPLPGRYRYERRRVHRIAADADVAAILTDGASVSDIIAWRDAEGVAPVDVLDTDREDLADGSTWFAPALGHDTLALLQYTSGSTGDPKGVMVSHGNLLANATSLCQTLRVDHRTRFGGWAPHFHDMGLMAETLPALFLGSTCVLMSPTAFLRRPVQWLQMIDRYDVGWSAAPNFAYELCCRSVSDEQVAELDLSRWRHAVNGSEPVRTSTLIAFAKRFTAAGFRIEAVSPCFGLAEATVFVSGAPPREPVTTRVDPALLEQHRFEPSARPGPGRELPSNGTAPYYDVRVVDSDTHAVLPEGRVGEIWLRGPNVAQGYWRNPAATSAVFQARTADGEEGFLRTGDLGAVYDGEIYVTGRLKETMVFRGRNLYPQDIEAELRAHHPQLGSVGAVFSVEPAAEDAPETMVIVHELRGRYDPAELRKLAAQIKLTVAREFGVGEAVVALLRRGGVRRTTSGKIERTTMRRLYLAGELTAEYMDDLGGPADGSGMSHAGDHLGGQAE